ncbi:MAG: ion transporter [Cytophagaceae bacterium]|nr:ion transporter [Cytophagaceae bacterium]MBK9935614.1 ion transporter [Cytophagaceae bacterium]MBL0302059.1 ion transporter [Cytophagaceae bacterium]
MDSKNKHAEFSKITFRRRIWSALNIRYTEKKGLSFIINISLSVLIFLNTIAIILNTIPSLSSTYHHIFWDFEVFSVIIFSIEYLLRLWSCVESRFYTHKFWGRIKFIFSFWGIVDLLAIAPFFLSAFVTDFGVIRMLRLLRILRLFRMSKYFHAFRIIKNVLTSKREELILAFSFIIFLILFSSSLMYFLEHPVQPENFSSIPAALWWGVNTMTTVGYGDIYPITLAGKILGSLVAISGISLFALPAGIIASGFNEHIRGYKNEQGKVKCPYCQAEYYLAEKHKHQH